MSKWKTHCAPSSLPVCSFYSICPFCLATKPIWPNLEGRSSKTGNPAFSLKIPPPCLVTSSNGFTFFRLKCSIPSFTFPVFLLTNLLLIVVLVFISLLLEDNSEDNFLRPTFCVYRDVEAFFWCLACNSPKHYLFQRDFLAILFKFPYLSSANLLSHPQQRIFRNPGLTARIF